MNNDLTDIGLRFENWITSTLPWQLKLKPNKEVAVKIKFDHFADWVRPLSKKAPQEFEQFYNELVKRFGAVSRWRTPKGAAIMQSKHKDNYEYYPNNKPRHTLVNLKNKD